MRWLGGFLILLPAAQTRAYFPQGVTVDKGCCLSCSKAALDWPTGVLGVHHSIPPPHASASGLPPHFIWGWQDRPAGPRKGDQETAGFWPVSPWGDRRLPISLAAEMLCPRETLLFVYCDSKELWRELWFILNSYCGSKHPCLFLYL